MIDNGVDYVVIDNGSVQKQIREIYPEGVNKVLELLGTGTLKDLLKCLALNGIVCLTGTLGNENKPAGFYTVNFDASKLSSGIYFYRIMANSFTAVKKMLLMK